jgi:DNA-binding NarL/FixJ family response regulator
MCRALKVLCAAASRAELANLKGGAVSVHWELVGGAASRAELREQLELHRPDVVVIDAALGSEAVEAARALVPGVRVVSVGVDGGPGDAWTASPEGIREAVLEIRRPGGPVRG